MTEYDQAPPRTTKQVRIAASPQPLPPTAPNQSQELNIEAISPLIEKISEKYLAAQLQDRKRSDEAQLSAINASLKKWADQVNADLKKAQAAAAPSGVDKASMILDAAVGDVKDRQLKIIEVTGCVAHVCCDCVVLLISSSLPMTLGDQRGSQETIGYFAPGHG